MQDKSSTSAALQGLLRPQQREQQSEDDDDEDRSPERVGEASTSPDHQAGKSRMGTSADLRPCRRLPDGELTPEQPQLASTCALCQLLRTAVPAPLSGGED